MKVTALSLFNKTLNFSVHQMKRDKLDISGII